MSETGEEDCWAEFRAVARRVGLVEEWAEDRWRRGWGSWSYPNDDPWREIADALVGDFFRCEHRLPFLEGRPMGEVFFVNAADLRGVYEPGLYYDQNRHQLTEHTRGLSLSEFMVELGFEAERAEAYERSLGDASGEPIPPEEYIAYVWELVLADRLEHLRQEEMEQMQCSYDPTKPADRAETEEVCRPARSRLDAFRDEGGSVQAWSYLLDERVHGELKEILTRGDPVPSTLSALEPYVQSYPHTILRLVKRVLEGQQLSGMGVRYLNELPLSPHERALLLITDHLE